MTNTDHGGTPADAIDELDALWEQFEDGLTAHLATMTDPAEVDHLRIELADPDPDGEEGCPPYAQFAAFGDGRMIRAEVSGNAYLLPQYRLGDEGCEFFAGVGWVGNLAHGDIEERNWSIERPVCGVDEIANHVTWSLRYYFGIAHPQLLTYEAWGPAAEGAASLGLCASDDVPLAGLSTTASPPLVQMATDRDDLVAFVGAVLRNKYEGEPTLDGDGDFVLDHMGQPVWVRVHADQPAVAVMARVAHNVHSRRATAVEIGLLNRDNLWTRWTLRDRTVWQTLMLPGLPFVPSHLDAMLDLFFEAMTATRDDLAYRTGARVA